eukprot:CAMPEP_0116909680 /NCGR_PEP_ID=MMETSP0467-20121206/14419_1 /TAXON_ID=283647 /ORGANISM="Mesodinium pulex, Strain SPMC105" /LENGTH=116 /DNA_ID=CAMNT_0004585083 /DNA_START=302 /DNA_END=653 /DNA_ORIENTATION=-
MSSDSRVSDHSDGVTCAETAEARAESGREVREALLHGLLGLGRGVRDGDVLLQDDRHDQALDAQDAAHDDGQHTLQIRSGFITPMLQMPTPDFAVPYAEPRFENDTAIAIPKNPKN